jgi:hypothetical protein
MSDATRGGMATINAAKASSWRRLVEHGVRFVTVYYSRGSAADTHKDNFKTLKRAGCRRPTWPFQRCSRPKTRGLFDDTLTGASATRQDQPGFGATMAALPDRDVRRRRRPGRHAGGRPTRRASLSDPQLPTTLATVYHAWSFSPRRSSAISSAGRAHRRRGADLEAVRVKSNAHACESSPSAVPRDTRWHSRPPSRLSRTTIVGPYRPFVEYLRNTQPCALRK